MEDTARTKSSIPRGFSRFFILQLIEEKPRTGKEVMDEAIIRSEGAWHPSPGLIYPLLGRLLAKGLVEDAEEGRYKITPKGIETLRDYSAAHEGFQKQFEILTKIGMTGKFLSQTLLDRLLDLTSTVTEKLDEMGKNHRDRYRSFLERELRRVNDTG